MAALFMGGYSRKTNNFIVVVFAVFAAFLVHGVSEDEAAGISLSEGDSVTLHTGVETKQQNKIKWHFKYTLIGQIIVNTGQICTGVDCNGTESFRGRLTLDNQTGSLTIMNIRNTDAGDYTLSIFSSSSKPRANVFRVSVKDSSATKAKRKLKVKRGESVTLDTDIQIKTTDVIKWHFNNNLIAEINGNITEGFRVDNQTGSLTIMNTTDSGDYRVEIIISRSNNFNVTILMNFSVNVTGLYSLFNAVLRYFILPPAAAAGFIAAIILGVSYYRRVTSKKNGKKNVKMIL